MLSVWGVFSYLRGTFSSISELQTGVLGAVATRPGWFCAGEGRAVTSAQAFLAMPVQGYFSQGSRCWRQVEWLISLFYVLSQCLIWNRETMYFKKKICFVATVNYPVLTVNREFHVMTRRHVWLHLCIPCISISDTERVKKSPWTESCLSLDFRQKPLGRRTYLSSTVFRWNVNMNFIENSLIFYIEGFVHNVHQVNIFRIIFTKAPFFLK